MKIIIKNLQNRRTSKEQCVSRPAWSNGKFCLCHHRQDMYINPVSRCRFKLETAIDLDPMACKHPSSDGVKDRLLLIYVKWDFLAAMFDIL